MVRIILVNISFLVVCYYFAVQDWGSVDSLRYIVSVLNGWRGPDNFSVLMLFFQSLPLLQYKTLPIEHNQRLFDKDRPLRSSPPVYGEMVIFHGRYCYSHLVNIFRLRILYWTFIPNTSVVRNASYFIANQAERVQTKTIKKGNN